MFLAMCHERLSHWLLSTKDIILNKRHGYLPNLNFVRNHHQNWIHVRLVSVRNKVTWHLIRLNDLSTIDIKELQFKLFWSLICFLLAALQVFSRNFDYLFSFDERSFYEVTTWSIFFFLFMLLIVFICIVFI